MSIQTNEKITKYMYDLIDKHSEFFNTVIQAFEDNPKRVFSFVSLYKQIAKHFYLHALEDIKNETIKL